MDVTAVCVVFIVIGLPVSLPFLRGFYKDYVKHRELKIQEKRLEMEERLKQDELNARIIHMDDFGMSPNDIAMLAQEVRMLRQELNEMKQSMNNRIGS